jgi:hypothetical protein
MNLAKSTKGSAAADGNSQKTSRLNPDYEAVTSLKYMFVEQVSARHFITPIKLIIWALV